MNAGGDHRGPTSAEPICSDDDRVVAALEEFGSLVRSGRRPDHRQFAAQFPDIADELQECLEGLELVQGFGAELVQDRGEAESGLQGTLGDYRIMREVGRGGMGVVYEAEQISLSRRVALKVLPFAATVDPRQLQRFRNESRAAASLRHDHIVHVYGVGCERGIHYYAMEFIDGQPLTAVIDALQQQKSGSATSYAETATIQQTAPLASLKHGSSELYRSMAELLAHAAEALDYAHGMGIIHRDIKPSNLLLDQRGKIWITDFGLAKLGADATGTLTGDLIGTLRYMSPEQALAHHGLVDHRTDIYALGATLYELLTLQPAVPGTDKQEVLQRIAFAEPVAPSALQPAVPRELETIVLKALEKRPDARYTTAREMANDLRRWLEDKPIWAKRPGLSDRLGKWARRHSGVVITLACASVLLLAVIAIGLAVNNRLIQIEQAQTQAALTAESKARHQAMAALQSLTDHFIERQFAQQEALDDEDRAFLQSTLKRYEEFAAMRGTERESRAIRAEGNYRVGILRKVLGDKPEARDCLEQAQKLYRDLTAQHADAVEYRTALGVAGCQLGTVLTELGQYEQAGVNFQEAVTIQQTLIKQFPTNVDYHRALARSLTELGVLKSAQSRPTEAIDEYRRAMVMREQVAKTAPGNRIYQIELAQCYNGLGNALKAIGDKSAAESAYRQTIAVTQKTLEVNAAFPSARRLLATAHSNLALVLAEQGETKAAEAEHRHALKQKKQLAADFPTIPNNQRELAMAHANFGVFLKSLNQLTAAEQEYRQALTIRKKLAADFPAETGYALDLLIGHNQLGTLLSHARRFPQAEAEFQSALAIGNRWANDKSVNPNQALNLANVAFSYCQLLSRTSRDGAAEVQIRRAIAILERLAADHADVPDYRFRLAMNRNSLGMILAKRCNAADAEVEYQSALNIIEQLMAAYPTNSAYAVEAGGFYCNYGLLHCNGLKGADALPFFAKAIAILTPVTEREPQLAPARLSLRNSFGGRARALELLNRHVEAVADWDRVIDLDQGPQRESFRAQRALCLARFHPGRAVESAEELIAGEKPPPTLLFEAARVIALAMQIEKDEAARKRWSDRAISLLQSAQERGYFKTSASRLSLQQDPDFESIRRSEEFMRLLRNLEDDDKP